MNSPTGQTRRRIFTLDGSNDADSRKDVPSGGFVNIAPHFGVKYPKSPNFFGGGWVVRLGPNDDIPDHTESDRTDSARSGPFRP